MIGFDEQFREYYTEALKLDWTGLDLWVVGGIVSGWETQDIDCVIMGDRPESEINQLMLQLKQCGPFSPYYTRDMRAVTYDRTSRTRLFITTYVANTRGDNLRSLVFKMPTTKNLVRRKRGIYIGEPIQLIQNGTQIYL